MKFLSNEPNFIVTVFSQGFLQNKNKKNLEDWVAFCKIIVTALWGKKSFVGWCNFEPSESFCSSHCLQGQEQTFTFFPFLHQPVYPSQLSSTESKQSVKETKIKTSILNRARLNFKLHVVQKHFLSSASVPGKKLQNQPMYQMFFFSVFEM